MWDMQEENDNILELRHELDINFYYRLAPYLNRDKSDDKLGYVMHVSEYLNRTSDKSLHKYWEDFFRALASKVYMNNFNYSEIDTQTQTKKFNEYLNSYNINGENKTIKPHLTNLPIIDFGEIEQGDNTKFSVSIPIFASPLDTDREVFDDKNVKDFHVRGAVWCAISLIHNTDLHDNGIPIYFHIEDKIFDIACEGFEQFNVPKHMIRKITPDKSESDLQDVLFGKKYLCLLDDEIETDAWFICDSDAFVCKENGKMKWYDKFTSESLSSKVITTKRWIYNYDRDNFYKWVYCVTLCVGMEFDMSLRDIDILCELEKQAYDKVGLIRPIDQSDQVFPRVCLWGQNIFMPTNHPAGRFYA